MLVFDVLKKAIELHHCVRIVTEGRWRDVCPAALGYKNSQLRLLAFQYRGESASGIGAQGGWRSFLLNEISSAFIVDDPWHRGDYPLWKIEASFDTVICGTGARQRVYRPGGRH